MSSRPFVASLAALVLVAASSGHATARPAACTDPEYRQFDFWLGDWKVVTPDGKPAGTNDVTSILGGCVLQEHWVGAGGGHGTSFNVYERAAKRWHQTWVDDSGGLLEVDGALENGVMMLRGTTPSAEGPVQQELSFTKVDGGKVRQLWRSSKDGGKTWAVVFDGVYVKK